VPPGVADAAVLRIKGCSRGIATAIDCNSRYCWLDPELGTIHAVAEASRNVSCTGALPLALTNCLNFGNPEKPHGYYQLSRAVAGMGKASKELSVPVVSGNVSLYNETSESAIMPTPTVGVVGVLEDVSNYATMVWKSGDIIVLVGSFKPSIGGSEYLAVVHQQIAGYPPTIDLENEFAVQQTVRELISKRLVKTAHDCSLGGLAIAISEMALVSDIGLTIDRQFAHELGCRLDETWFGETASCIIVSCSPDKVANAIELANAQQRSVTVSIIGTVGGSEITLGAVATLSLADARARYEGALLR
jgi:phosphoribosylformylglycinamidine synthase